jgi:hypothetical protein
VASWSLLGNHARARSCVNVAESRGFVFAIMPGESRAAPN